MRHGLLATDATVILPTHNYTQQQHLFCMDDSQTQIQISPVCALSDTESAKSMLYLSANSGLKSNSIFLDFTLHHLDFLFPLI